LIVWSVTPGDDVVDNLVRSDADFAKQIEDINAALEDAVDRVMDAKPDAFILGISALSVWGGRRSSREISCRLRMYAGLPPRRPPRAAMVQATPARVCPSRNETSDRAKHWAWCARIATGSGAST